MLTSEKPNKCWQGKGQQWWQGKKVQQTLANQGSLGDKAFGHVKILASKDEPKVELMEVLISQG